ncbi:MAG: RdgB/HAM1 family non-canonical purine NTP pyrophosphatase [Planctomycetes bacterium]|nr:RdgB/HAM1 family non-canonical purine NTP pyrophosphatase [Planctomycetota bacterium]
MKYGATVVVGSANPHKVREVVRILAGLGLALRPLADFPGAPAVVEDAGTFAGNAAKKARELSAALGLPVLADDSGLSVDALGGRPGVRSARYAGPGATALDNHRRLLEELRGCPGERRGARFTAAVALAVDGRVLLEAEGHAEGRILEAPRGTNGFGYDPLFWSEPHGRSFAELSPEEKDRASHRGRALGLVRERLAGLLLSAT